jgi:peptide/nickel transport system substrate-binding protein
MSEHLGQPLVGLSAHSRRDFLGYSLKAVAAAGAGTLLAACSSSGTKAASSATSKSATSVAATRPKRGGTLTVGLTGGGSGDTINAGHAAENLDFTRMTQLYDVLVEADLNSILQPALAEEITANSDSTVWTIRLRKGVTFHNGKDLTSEDVLFTINRIVSEKTFGAAGFTLVDVKNIKIVDPLTLQVPCLSPYSTFQYAFYNHGFAGIIPVGYDPTKPVGTGPFMYKSFTPGQESVFVKNPNYWQDGEDGLPLPYVDQLVISDYSDESSMVNALVSGAVSAISPLTPPSIAALTGGGKSHTVSEAGYWVPFCMRTDVAPFNLVDVRQAFRLLVNRPQMLEEVYSGLGTVGNDLFAVTDPAYDTSLPQRVQDIEQAKFLLKKHGLENMTTTLVTGDIYNGAVQAATVFAEQAKAAGVTVNLSNIPSSTLYGPNYLKWTFSQDWWGPNPYLIDVSQATLNTAPINECHFDNAQYNQLYSEALAAPFGSTKQTDIVHEMMTIDYNEGGYIIPFFAPSIDGYAPNVVGPVPNKIGPLSGGFFKTFWFK